MVKTIDQYEENSRLWHFKVKMTPNRHNDTGNEFRISKLVGLEVLQVCILS